MAGQSRTKDSLSRANRQRLTEARKTVFLEELRKHGVFARAARAASPRASDGAVSTFKDEAARNPSFARQIDEAREQADADLLVELRRRAVDGDQVPIQNAKGETIGWRSLRSDKLLLELVRARHREFTPRTQTEATVEQTVTQAKPKELPLDWIDRLLPENQDKLREILQSENARPDGYLGMGDAYGKGSEPRRNGHAPSRALPVGERER